MRGPSTVFYSPVRCLISGPSLSGKTTWLFNFFKNMDVLLDEQPVKIYYYFRVHQPLYEKMEALLKDRISFRQGLPSEEEILEIGRSSPSHKMLCVDDQGGDVTEAMANLYAVFCHHYRISAFVLLHRLFTPHNKFVRDLSLSSSHLILRRSIRDSNESKMLWRQFGGQKAKSYQAAYEKAMANSPYGYMIVNMQPECKDEFRLYTNIFPEEYPPTFYVIK